MSGCMAWRHGILSPSLSPSTLFNHHTQHTHITKPFPLSGYSGVWGTWAWGSMAHHLVFFSFSPCHVTIRGSLGQRGRPVRAVCQPVGHQIRPRAKLALCGRSNGRAAARHRRWGDSCHPVSGDGVGLFLLDLFSSHVSYSLARLTYSCHWPIHSVPCPGKRVWGWRV
jgi:hypothetical protein